MRTETPKTIYLKDYKPYPYDITTTDLHFDIHDGKTTVTSILNIIRKPNADKDEPLILNGEELSLNQIKINDTEVTQYEVNDTHLILNPDHENFTLEIQVTISPEANTHLEGLYMSGGNYCTQCEAEGFRRITYFPDRPDVLSTYTVTLEADEKYPVLLSNGNLKEKNKTPNNRHTVTWHDPFPKPSYLFALVAGDLNHIHDIFTTNRAAKLIFISM